MRNGFSPLGGIGMELPDGAKREDEIAVIAPLAECSATNGARMASACSNEANALSRLP